MPSCDASRCNWRFSIFVARLWGLVRRYGPSLLPEVEVVELGVPVVLVVLVVMICWPATGANAGLTHLRVGFAR